MKVYEGLLTNNKREEMMYNPEEVDKILALHQQGWGSKRIAKEMKISRNTVRKYINQKGWKPYKTPIRSSTLKNIEEWIEKRFYLHRGNSAVIQEELEKTHRIKVSLRTVERATEKFRKSLKAKALATVRFETPPGKQLQIDFGTIQVMIDGEKRKVHLFVATLGYSRRIYVAAFPHERQSSWFKGLEDSFYHFGGMPKDVLIDNARPLVDKNNPQTREVVFNNRFKAFAQYWGFNPKACAPYRARTKGKDERAVGYVKRNAIAGREFSSWEAFHSHLELWMRNTADERIHGSTKEKPIIRFEREEARALTPLNGRPPFVQQREVIRKVQSDSCVEVDTNRYSVPWEWIKQIVTIQVHNGSVLISQGGQEIACHKEQSGSNQTVIDHAHLKGIIGAAPNQEFTSSLERPLSEYETIVGGGW